MTVEVKVPKIGVEMQSAVVDNWLIKNGEWIEKNDILLEIQTDKVTYEVESPSSGYVKIFGEEGQEYKIGEVLAEIVGKMEELQAGNTDAPSATQHVEKIKKKESVEYNASQSVPTDKKVKASPLARKIAWDQQLNLAEIKGTGPSGAIVKEDILRKLQDVSPIDQQEETQQDFGLTHAITDEIYEKVEASTLKAIKDIRKISPIRRTIAQKMKESLLNTAQMTDINEFNVTELVKFRNELKELQGEIGYKISYLELFVKITAIILKKIPELNASIEENKITYWEDINIGIAVAIEDGLVVPVIHQADKLSLLEIHHKLQELIKKAKTNKLSTVEMSGGTFTITNIGSYGGYYGTPIINPPEVAIWGMGAILQKPVIVNGEIIVGEMIGSSLTVDHRLIDGEVAGRFQSELKKLVENPKLIIAQ
ncbi:dihydrolipoamide acetyltransferase family protein [Planococcus beijingensis]|uniref:dihydrolipoamide acetyltransferase family protein n=1 Tax=Planococcus beijingensis TaxID=2782551 RepID=UPI00193BB40B|nr:dihydrolipoamide acetyltransferase family protein [Planococcus beijingensis]